MSHFHRGVTTFYLFREWQTQTARYPDVQKLLYEAIKEFEMAWKEQPSAMRGAVLMDAYGDKDRRLNIAFTEQFLRWADPGYTYQHLKAAQKNKFKTFGFDLGAIPQERKHLVLGILSERWSVLSSGKKQPGSEAVMLDKWCTILEKDAGIRTID